MCVYIYIYIYIYIHIKGSPAPGERAGLAAGCAVARLRGGRCPS